MDLYKPQIKTAADEAVDLLIATQYDSTGNEITATYATKTELVDLCSQVMGVLMDDVDANKDKISANKKEIDSIKNEISLTNDEISSHENNTQNPHGVTAVQVGALPLTGGTLTGELTSPKVIKARGFQQSDTSLNYVDLITGNGTNFGLYGEKNTFYNLAAYQNNLNHGRFISRVDTRTFNLDLKGVYAIFMVYVDLAPSLQVGSSSSSSSVTLQSGLTLIDQRAWTTRVIVNGTQHGLGGTDTYNSYIRLTGGSGWNCYVYKLGTN